MNKIEFILNFKKETFSPNDIIEILNSDLGIDKGFIELGVHNAVKYSEEYFEDIRNQKGNLYLTIREKKNESSHFTIVTPGHVCPPQNLIWEFDSFKYPPSEVFSRLIQHKNFVFGYAADIEDQYRQNETHENNYFAFGLKPKRIKYRIDPLLGWKVIDITKNPGRRELVCKTWITSTWKMWFGKTFFEYVPKDRILAFTKCNYAKELSSDVIEIQLYENPFKASRRRNRRIQQEFRDWIGIDNLIEKLDKERDKIIEGRLLVNNGDEPVCEFSFGYKTTWIAIKCDSTQKVIDFFKQDIWKPIDFKTGVNLSYDGKKFITPVINGWVLFTSSNLSTTDTDKGVKEVITLLNYLSLEFQEANYFSNHRGVGYCSWAKSINGSIERGFSIVDGDEPIWIVGNKSGIEKNFIYPFEKSNEPDNLKVDIPDEEMVMEIARDWSIDPTNLNKFPELKNKMGYMNE